MQIIMSPAKLLDFKGEDIQGVSTTPRFSEMTDQIVEVCKTLSVQDIEQEMKVNHDIANTAYGWFQSFNSESVPTRAASLAYNGIAYKGLGANDFDSSDIEYAQGHLNIVSGLWGMLRPFDIIKPYRLEMVRKIQPEGYKNLYDFWKPVLNKHLSDSLVNDEKVIINLASKEYSKVLTKSLLPKNTRIVDIVFLQQQGDDFKQIVVHTKKARGLMSRFIIKNKLLLSEEAKAFNYEDYFFYPHLSEEDKWVFVR